MKTHPLKQPLILIRAAAFAAAALLAVTALGQTTTTTNGKLKRGDRTFIEKAAKAGMEEVQLGEVVSNRSTNPEIKKFADTMVSDHQRIGDELATLAANKGVALPAKDAKPSKWETKDGKNFDKDYIDQMVKNHDDAVKLFEKEATDGEDPDVVAFARQMLPKLQHHQEMAVDLKKAYQ